MERSVSASRNALWYGIDRAVRALSKADLYEMVAAVQYLTAAIRSTADKKHVWSPPPGTQLRLTGRVREDVEEVAQWYAKTYAKTPLAATTAAIELLLHMALAVYTSREEAEPLPP